MMTGRFHPLNNFELGIRSVMNTDYNLLLAGLVEDKFLSYYRRIKELVLENVSLRDRVTIKTLTEEALIEQLQSCSIFLSPRKYDYLGHSALEPMACGKPVVQLVTESGLEEDPPVIPCDDSADRWREAVQTLMEDKETRINLGRRAHEFVQQKHSLKASVNQVLHHATLLYESFKKGEGFKTRGGYKVT
jgi:glycosyltransferase involved in cell wall biosynthesis